MATYTGVADANGDFTILFSQNYTGGQKVTVKAEKDGAEKSVELYAPSEVVGGSAPFQITGDFSNYPNSIGDLTINVGGVIKSDAFESALGNGGSNIFRYLKNIYILGSVTRIESQALINFRSALTIDLPPTLLSVGNYGLANMSSLTNLICRAVNPPSLGYDALSGLGSSCVIRVPANSVNTYKSAEGWSIFSNRIEAI